jgi:hypothetical protein
MMGPKEIMRSARITAKSMAAKPLNVVTFDAVTTNAANLKAFPDHRPPKACMPVSRKWESGDFDGLTTNKEHFVHHEVSGEPHTRRMSSSCVVSAAPALVPADETTTAVADAADIVNSQPTPNTTTGGGRIEGKKGGRVGVGEKQQQTATTNAVITTNMTTSKKPFRVTKGFVARWKRKRLGI